MSSEDEVIVIDPALLPKKGVKYPLIVDYCNNCSMPLEVNFWSIYVSFNKIYHTFKII